MSRGTWKGKLHFMRNGLVLVALAFGAPALAGNPDGDLRIELISAYNLVVDSNAGTPSSYAPRSAYLGAKFCNDGTNALTDVWAYIGDYTNGTPGIYPSRSHLTLVGPLPDGEFAFEHEGGALGTADATRFLGTIQPGECVTVYWLISYPHLDENGVPVWGPSVKPDDDLWLEYNVWGTAMDGAAPLEADVSRTLTMRNEISAMANKIFPNGANKVPQEYQDLLAMYEPSWTNTAADGTPGTVIYTEGVWYDLGNIGAGFDNDGDLIPDRNAWMQPVGDPDLFDPSCFRLVKTYALVIVKLNDGTELVINAEDQLYFTNLPENNRGAVGYVRYEFLSLRSGCSSTLTPYQEVASGKDNEKFNGDYGATLGQGLSSGQSKVEIEKSADPAAVAPGGTIDYAIAFTNAGEVAVGLPELFLPLVVQDAIPDGTAYVAGSAAAGNTLPPSVTTYVVYYSTNSGASWTTTEPATAADVTDLQWWLSGALQPGEAGTVTFSVTVDSPYTESLPYVPNTAGLSLGNTFPFDTADALTLLKGSNSLSGVVWADDGEGGGVFGNGEQDGSEAGISNILVTLYYDLNGDGILDAGDLFLSSTNSAAGTGAYAFGDLLDGNYLVVVDPRDPDMPLGYTPTTETLLAVDLDSAGTNPNPVNSTGNDFGFAPALVLEKTGPAVLTEDGLATYSIVVSNRFAGDGSGGGIPVTATAWASELDADNSGTGNKAWESAANAYTPPGPDGNYALCPYENATETLGVSGYTFSQQSGAITNVQLRIPLQVTGTFGAGETVQINLILRPTTTFFTTNVNATTLTNGTLTLNVTAARSWGWTNFGTNLTVQLVSGRSGNNTGQLSVDAVGFRVETDGTVGEASGDNTLDPVRLEDLFDTTRLSFLSADPALTSLTTNGTTGRLYWDNVGPIYPGGTATATVQFAVLEPPGNVATPTTNRAVITNATYRSGLPANSATSDVVSAVAPAGRIGDFVWRDLNANGIQDGGAETGIAGVSVVLTPPPGVDIGNGAGNPITNVTDSTGYYLFNGLTESGDYTVTVLTATLPGGSGANTWDRDGNQNNQTTVALDVTSINGGDTILNADFGYNNIQSVITGTIWDDVNRSGTTSPDTAEPWLSGVVVRLYDSNSVLVATATTGVSGAFTFLGMFDGDYTVQVDTNSGPLATGTWAQTFDTDGTNTAHEVAVTVPLGGQGRADYSYVRTGAWDIGDTLFYDWNGNGMQDANDEGMANITVRLYRDSTTNGVYDPLLDPLVATAVTDSDGNYLFADLPDGDYIVVVDRTDPDFPPLYDVTADPYGAMDGISAVTIAGADDLDQDFGFQPYGFGAIGDTVWRDLNADGLQAGLQETGISNILVSLYADFNGDGIYVLLQTTNTAANGTYLFSDLPDGNYRVVVDANDTDLPMDAFGNPFYASTGTSVDITLSGGNTDLSADFGFAPYAAIGDTIFWDANRNGTQDTSEEGIPGVTVNLYLDVNGNGIYDAGETFLTNAVTDANGVYLFDGLLPGNYVVVVDGASGPLVGATLSADPDSDGLTCDDPENVVPCDGEHGRTLLNGQNFMGADFGYIPPGAVIGDTVWLDTNDNGIRDANETGIAFIPVVLYSNGVAIATNLTDSEGWYYFSNLGDAIYSVAVDTNDAAFPAGLMQTFDPDGALDSFATNIVVSGGSVVSVGGVSCTDCDLSIDFGYRYAGNNSLSGTIGLDAQPYDGLLNGMATNGVGVGESPYPNVQVYLYLWNDDGDGIIESGEYVLISSTFTAANGDYLFTGLPNGDGDDQYIVSSIAPEDYLKLTTTNGSIPDVTVTETVNAQGNTVSAYLVVDIIQDTDIYNMDFAYRSTVDYDYGDLPQSYQTLGPDGARHIVPAVPNLYLGALVDTEPNGLPSPGADGDDLDGSDDEDGVEIVGVWQDGPGGGTLQVTVGAGSGWLLGYIDFNNNGTFLDAGELAINRAVSSSGGVSNDGVYTITVDVPPGAINAATTTTLFARFRLMPSQPYIPELAYAGTAANGEVEDYAWDILGSIGDYVWEDLNGDGVQDVGEPPIPGVRVFIDLNGNGQWDVGEPFSITDNAGLYYIGGLTPDTYSVRVDTNTLAFGLIPTYDRDGIVTKHVASVTLTQGEVIRDVDFGYKIAVADIAVWKTADTNAVFESGTVVFTIAVTNFGPDLAETIIIGDLLPAGLTYVSDTPSQGTYNDVTGLWDVGALAASASAWLQIETTADIGTGGMILTNSATRVDSVPADPNPSNDVSSAVVTVRGADLAVYKSVDNLRPNEGDTLTYRIAVTNRGPSDTTGVVIEEAIPAGLTYVIHMTSQGTYDTGTDLWTVGSLAYGAGAWLEIEVTIDYGTLGTVITNVASVYANDLPDPVSTNNSAAVRIYIPPLVLYKTSSPTEPVSLGDTITYTIVATNIGPWAHTNVVITDPIPAGTIFVPGSVTFTSYPPRADTIVSYRDEFSARTYTNQNGGLLWSTAWAEGGESDGPTNGSAQVLSTGWASLGLARSLARSADLSTADSAELSFTIRHASTVQTNNIRDEFGTVAYTNSNGNLPWDSNWVESNDDALPNSGTIQVTGGLLRFLNSSANAQVGRWARLTGHTNAVLSFDYVATSLSGSRYMDVYVVSNTTEYLLQRFTAAGSGTASYNLNAYLAASNRIIFRANGWNNQQFTVDNVNLQLTRPMQSTLDNAFVEVSTNGSSWTTLFYANGNISGTVTTNYDLTAYRSPQTTVRFRTAGYTNTGAQLWFDNVDIELTKKPGADEVGDPPTLLSGWTLGTNEAVEITYQVTVDETIFTTQVVNTASAVSDLQDEPVWASATNEVDLVGVRIGGVIWFDQNKDGLQDAGETNRITNLVVTLYYNGNPIRSQNTDGNGAYLFEQLVPGDYYVIAQMTNVSLAVIVSPSFVGEDREIDSDFTLHESGSGESLVRYGDSPSVSYADGESDLFIDMGISLLSSTRAEVAEVWGEGRDGEGVVVWSTSSEFGTAGFFVYRVDPVSGDETCLNDRLVPSGFNEAGSIYELADPEASDGGAGRYRLEEVELSGSVLDLGLHDVAFAAPPPVAKAARAEAAAAKSAAPLKTAAAKLSGPSGILKVSYRREGFYGIALQAVADGMGMDLEDVRALAQTDRLALSDVRGPVPVRFDSLRERLVFHGAPADNWYARDAAVRIEIGDSLPMPRREPAASGGATAFPVRLRFEEDLHTLNAAPAMPDDFYYWDMFYAGFAGYDTKESSLDLSGVNGDVELAVRMVGWSATAFDSDHLAEFSLNGEPIGSVTFDGQDAAVARMTVPAAQVQDGANVLTVKAVLQPGHSHSYFVLDWIEASFVRELVPAGGTLHFRAGGAPAVSAAAFDEPLALALDEAGSPTWIADADGALPAKAWVVVASSQERFAVIEADAVPLLQPEAVNPDPWFLAADNRIDYLVIVSRELEAAAQELADYREGQGLRVGVATFEDLCDWMAGGLRTPEAIPALLAYAAETWAEAPWMMVLAGNGSFDYLDALGTEPNHVPPMLVAGFDGLFASDNLLGDIDGDGLPDVAVGRLPALTAADLTAMIAKIKAYEAGFGESWLEDLVLVSDKTDAGAGEFRKVSDAVEAIAGGDYPVAARIDLDAMAIAPARAALTNRFRTGAGFIHYTGHGGVANWSGQNLLRSTDVSRMNNPTRPPVTVALSCLVGRFEAPGVNSLGELLMRKAGGGSVAVWGPSGLSRHDPAAALGEAFYRTILQEGSGTLGLAVLKAIRSVPLDLFAADTLSFYNLLGDPALRIANQTGGHDADDTFAQWRWQRFSPADLADPETSGATPGHFFTYSMGGGFDVLAELPEFGFDLPPGRADGENAGEPGFVLRWKRRVHRADVDYRMVVSGNLRNGWQPAAEGDVQELGADPDPDGVMETVRTRILLQDNNRVFIGIQARRK
jgi:uncharacterized repeat protein (TIGR01451 family)